MVIKPGLEKTQIKMTLFHPPNYTTGADDILVTTAQSVQVLPIMILVFTYLLVALGGSSNQKRRIGTADYPFWFVLAGVATTMLALIFTLGGGFIDLLTLGAVVSVTIMSGVWFFLSKVRGEP